MKRNFSGYPSSMFIESQSARGPKEVVNLFAEFFQGVYVSEGEPVLDEQKGPGPKPSTLRKLVSVFKVPVTLLFNMSLSIGIFPAV
jgi:hypothetical protein